MNDPISHSTYPPRADLFRPALTDAFDGVWVAVTRTGFKSHDDGYGLNYGAHVGDCLEDVHRRRAALEAEVGVPLVWLNQVHGVEVCLATPLLASNSNLNPPQADASVLANCDSALAIMTADCLPVVFVARNTRGVPVGVAAAHAGWKGLLNGVLSNAVLSLAQATSQPVRQIAAWLGPAIGPQSFEVGEEVREAFLSGFASNSIVQPNLQPTISSAFTPAANAGKWLADLYQLARISLNQSGVGHVECANPPEDTFTDLSWFSHRRAALLGRQAGRMATLVRLLPR